MQVARSKWCALFSTSKLCFHLSLLFLLVALLRVASTYPIISQASDEPATIGTGIEWLDRGTYDLDPLHPPLARVASALAPYLSGVRFPATPGTTHNNNDWNPFWAGNQILGQGRHYWRILTLARLGMVPFLVLGVFIVMYWTRELAGSFAAVVAVLLFTTLPPILAFTGFAYTDMPVAVLVAASAFTFQRWLRRPSPQRSIFCAAASGLAVLSKFTALLFVPVCWLAIGCCWLFLVPRMVRRSVPESGVHLFLRSHSFSFFGEGTAFLSALYAVCLHGLSKTFSFCTSPLG